MCEQDVVQIKNLHSEHKKQNRVSILVIEVKRPS